MVWANDGPARAITGVWERLPTLGEWILLGLGLVLLAAAAYFLRAGRQAPKATKK